MNIRVTNPNLEGSLRLLFTRGEIHSEFRFQKKQQSLLLKVEAENHFEFLGIFVILFCCYGQ